jgi:oligoribonuclease
MSDEYLVWVDVETSGLDANNDFLLEVAAIITNLDATVEYGEFHRTLYYGAPSASWIRDCSNTFVRDMHDKTGLWDRLPDGDQAYVVDQDLLEFISTMVPEPRKARLAGNSVRLDLNFIAANLPLSYAHLHYRSVDVSALAYVMADCWGVVDGYFEKKKSHAALDDIRESIDEYKWLHAQVKELQK